jgi:hypothetical protein
MKYSQPLTHYAKAYGKGIATIKRWSSAGAPLDNPDAMGEWMDLKQRRGGPKAEPSEPADSFTDPYPRVPPPESEEESELVDYATLPKGAAQALKRLEETETKLYQRLETALSRGGSMAIAAAREDWLKCSESLRKYDLLVEQSRRESGELVPRVEAENAALMSAVWLRLAFMAFVSSEAKALLELVEVRSGEPFIDPRKFASLAFKGMRNAVDAQLRNSANAQVELAPWAVTKIKEGFNVSSAD